MYSFKNDYSEGAHPRILKAMIDTNMIQEPGYGYDTYTEEAIALLKKEMSAEDMDIHLLVGGTQTNLTAISAFIRPYEAVIAPVTGHIFVNEAGAIEATGHKIITVPSEDGKMKPEQIKEVLDIHHDEHTVKPKLVYISNPTEVGTVYTKRELTDLKVMCEENGLYLYIDGARLGSALRSKENDVELSDLAVLSDSFYIGGTKSGALFGEALVIINPSLRADFRYNIKQKGAMLAKSRLLGLQFRELFKDGLYYELADHANDMAQKLKEGIEEAGWGFLAESSTNQLFPILPNKMIEQLEQEYEFYRWKKVDQEHSAIRLITSWATDEAQVERFIGELKTMSASIGKRENVYS